jgi:hypothetical protein
VSAPPYIAVVGASQPSESQERVAEEVGRLLGDARAIVITGGLGGVMAAASRGAAQTGAIVVGLLPGSNRHDANEWMSVALATGLGELRNGLVVRAADAVIAIGGAYGTLSEIALAMAAGTPVVAVDSWPVDGVEAVASPRTAVARVLELAAGRGPA